MIALCVKAWFKAGFVSSYFRGSAGMTRRLSRFCDMFSFNLPASQASEKPVALTP